MLLVHRASLVVSPQVSSQLLWSNFTLLFVESTCSFFCVPLLSGLLAVYLLMHWGAFINDDGGGGVWKNVFFVWKSVTRGRGYEKTVFCVTSFLNAPLVNVSVSALCIKIGLDARLWVHSRSCSFFRFRSICVDCHVSLQRWRSCVHNDTTISFVFFFSNIGNMITQSLVASRWDFNMNYRANHDLLRSINQVETCRNVPLVNTMPPAAVCDNNVVGVNNALVDIMGDITKSGGVKIRTLQNPATSKSGNFEVSGFSVRILWESPYIGVSLQCALVLRARCVFW